jgi:hypothetical protein
MGIDHTSKLTRHLLHKRVEENKIKTFAELYPEVTVS